MLNAFFGTIFGALGSILRLGGEPHPENLTEIYPGDRRRLMLWLFENINEPCTWQVDGVYIDDGERMAELAGVPYNPKNPETGFDVNFHPSDRRRFQDVIAQCNFEDDFWWQKISVGERCILVSYDMMNPLFLDLQYFPQARVEEASRSGLFKMLDAKGLPI